MNKEKIFCKICNQQTNFVVDSFSRWHLKKNHNTDMKTYYDNHIKQKNEGICGICGKETLFKSYNKGYSNHCSLQCSGKSEERRIKISKSCETRDYEKVTEKFKQTSFEKYGGSYTSTEEYKEKRNKTYLEKYGISSYDFLNDSLSKAREIILENKEKINEKRRKFWTSENIEKVNETRVNTCIERYGVENTSKLESTKVKIKGTCKDRYGVESHFQLNEIKEKIKQTFLEKYGEEYISRVMFVKEKIKKTSLENYSSNHYLSSVQRRKLWELLYGWIPFELKSEAEKYYSTVWNYTRKNIHQLFKNWDGFCYYTGENLNKIQNHDKQATIDHKISVNYGFLNNIPPEEIGDIKNLCVSSRYINIKKNRLTEEQFLEKLKSKEIKL